MTAMEDQVSPRYSWCGDEFLFVEMDESMSLETFLRAGRLADAVSADGIDGITDVCPTNTSLLLRYDPDVIAPHDLRRRVGELEEAGRRGQHSQDPVDTRVFEVPVWYRDPFTSEVAARFRSHHQTPDKSDLEFVADINGLADADALIERHHGAPWMVTAVGFVAGLPFMYQMVPRTEQIETPKYLSPRTDTPALTVGHGGCFSVVYSVRGAGGYQMFGIAAAPIFAPDSPLQDFQDSMVLFRSGDIVKFTPIGADEYEEIQRQCAEGVFRYRSTTVPFDVREWQKDPATYNASVMEALDGIAG
jgi:urea carboxylase